MSAADLTVYLALDYSQVEIRELAELSGDKLLIQQFNSGIDIHSQVGHMLTGWPVEQIRKDHDTRKKIKNFHFGLVYGLTEEGMYDYLIAKKVKISRKEVSQYYRKYFSTYTGVAAFIEKMRAKAERDGYVENLFGFRRELGNWDEGRDTYVGNQAINSPVQGTAHHLLLMAIAILHLKKQTYNLLQKPVMEVHDALYFWIKLRDLSKAFFQAKQLMEKENVGYVKRHFKYTLRVPLLAESKAGFCLGSMIDYEGEPYEEFLPKWQAEHLKVEKESWDKLAINSV